MDREVWWATVYGSQKIRQDLATNVCTLSLLIPGLQLPNSHSSLFMVDI